MLRCKVNLAKGWRALKSIRCDAVFKGIFGVQNRKLTLVGSEFWRFIENLKTG